MKIKKALAGILLSVSIAGGIVTPASVAFATDEVAPAVPAAEAVTEASVTYNIDVQYLDIDTGYAIRPFQAHRSISEGVYTFAPATIAGYRYEGFFYINNSDKGEGSIAKIDTSKFSENWISVDFYYKKVNTTATTTEEPKTTEVPKTTTTEAPKTTEEPKVEEPKVQAPAPVYRLYQPDLKVHLYTKDTNEYKVLATRGWKQEGISWRTETQKGDAVYRLYHPDLKVHLYTKDTNENKVLATRGWKQEGVAYRSFGSVPVYRLYHAGIRKHLYTKDANEYKVLATRGWLQEGVAWYSQP